MVVNFLTIFSTIKKLYTEHKSQHSLVLVHTLNYTVQEKITKKKVGIPESSAASGQDHIFFDNIGDFGETKSTILSVG